MDYFTFFPLNYDWIKKKEKTKEGGCPLTMFSTISDGSRSSLNKIYSNLFLLKAGLLVSRWGRGADFLALT